MEKGKIIERAVALGKSKDSTKVLLKALGVLKIKRKNVIRKIVFILFELLIAITISRVPDTIEMAESVTNIFNVVLLALFAIVFTGYAFFQALINDKLLLYMIKEDATESDCSSKLEETNLYFAKVMMLQFSVIIINALLLIILGILPVDWCLSANNAINETLSALGIVVLLHLNIESIWETKSFIFNVTQLFNAHAMSRIINILENDEQNGEDE